MAVYVSPQIEHMLGFTPEEWVGDPDLWWGRSSIPSSSRSRARP